MFCHVPTIRTLHEIDLLEKHICNHSMSDLRTYTMNTYEIYKNCDHEITKYNNYLLNSKDTKCTQRPWRTEINDNGKIKLSHINSLTVWMRSKDYLSILVNFRR